MSDGWFSEYLFQIVAPRRFVAAHLLDVYDHGHVTTLPPWDVLGQSLSLFLFLSLSLCRAVLVLEGLVAHASRPSSRILRLGPALFGLAQCTLYSPSSLFLRLQ